MPLIKCPICQADVSSNAPACPKCGEPIKSSVEKANGAINMKDPVHIIGVILVVIIVLGVIISIFNS